MPRLTATVLISAGLVTGVLLAGGPALAAGGTSDAFQPKAKSATEWSAEYDTAVKAIDAGRYQDAITLLENVVTQQPRNADALNYLGFAHRKLGSREKSLGYYQAALQVNPNHRGAREYLGELYIQMGDLPKAEEQLATLGRLCPSGCPERDELTSALAKARGQSS